MTCESFGPLLHLHSCSARFCSTRPCHRLEASFFSSLFLRQNEIPSSDRETYFMSPDVLCEALTAAFFSSEWLPIPSVIRLNSCRALCGMWWLPPRPHALLLFPFLCFHRPDLSIHWIGCAWGCFSPTSGPLLLLVSPRMFFSHLFAWQSSFHPAGSRDTCFSSCLK